MPIQIDGVTYFSSADVAQHVGVSRVTLWRWRHEKKIPAGHRLRGKHVIFTASEMDAIRDFALRVEPIAPDAPDQLTLFRAPPR
jgi:predicted DNA-binding transcriptional regulator AlpA